jgi:hypothetical protein
VVRDQSSGDEWVFAVDSAGTVEGWERTPTTTAWTLLPLTGGAAAAAGTEPIAVLNTISGAPQPIGHIAVYYIGADGRMWSYQFTPSGGWSSDELPGAGATPAPDASPTVIYAPTAAGSNPEGFETVFYIAANGQMWNYNFTTSTGWTAYALPNAGARPAAGTSPSLVVNAAQTGPNPAGFAAIYYVGDDGEIWNDNFTPASNWTSYAIGGFGRVGVGDTRHRARPQNRLHADLLSRPVRRGERVYLIRTLERLDARLANTGQTLRRDGNHTYELAAREQVPLGDRRGALRVVIRSRGLG